MACLLRLRNFEQSSCLQCSLLLIYSETFMLFGILRFTFWSTWDRCYDFRKYLRQNNLQKLAFLTQNKAKLCKNFERNIVFFWEKRQFFAKNYQMAMLYTKTFICKAFKTIPTLVFLFANIDATLMCQSSLSKQSERQNVKNHLTPSL
jgi:hypothetical protein